MNGSVDKPVLSPSGIGQYIAFSECPRYFKLRFDDEGEENDRAWNEAFKPLSVLLSGTGDNFEAQTRRDIEKTVSEGIDAEREWEFDYDFEEEFPEAFAASRVGFSNAVEKAQSLNPGEDPILLYEAPLCGFVHGWPIGGRADVVVIYPSCEGVIRTHILEIKASWKRKSYHQIQAAIYAILLEDIFSTIDAEFDIKTGVIHRETNEQNVSPDNLPTFDLQTRKQDVERLLAEDGKIASIIEQDVDEVDYQLNAKCNNCIFNESCFTRSVEERSTALLGLSIGEQRALGKYGIETIDELAGLKEIPENPVPWEYENLEPREESRETVDKLVNEPAVGGKLDKIIQRAQAMVSEVKQDPNNGRDEPYVAAYSGAGNGTLPDDDPPDWDSINYDSGEMIRVYLYVEWDYMRDRLVMLNARVDCSRYSGDPHVLSDVAESLPVDPEGSRDVEKELLDNFFQNLFNSIQDIAEATGNPEEIPIHLYTFSKLERDRLLDAIRRHSEYVGADDSGEPHPIRDLLGLRAAIDQSMLSVVQDDVKQRFALKYPSTGLLPTLGQFYDNSGDGWWDGFSEWREENENGEIVNLWNVFYHNFFNYESPFTYNDDGSVQMLLQRGGYYSEKQDGDYPLRARFGNQIPLEYFWAAKDELDESWVDDGQSQELRAIEKYKWYDRKAQNNRIRERELELLGQKLCKALQHIENSIIGKNALLGKEPIRVPNLDDFNLGESSLSRACREYLDLEYYSNRQEMLRHYAKSPRQRVQTGRSTVLRVENVDQTDEGAEVEGHLMYDEMGFGSPDSVANSCRLKGSESSTSGSWMVATELEIDSNGMYTEKQNMTPKGIEGSVPTKIQRINTENRQITVKFSNFYNEEEGFLQYQNREYETSHDSWTVKSEQAGNHTQYISEGDTYILDKRTDNMTARRVRNTLEDSDDNNLAKMLERLLDGEIESNEIDYCSSECTADFLDWLEDAEKLDSPNERQRRFIQQDDQRIACLQGPPGTGKTGGALAYSIICRAYSKIAEGDHIRGIVTAPSNKAVYEIMEDVAEVREAFQESGEGILSELQIVRASGRSTEDMDQVDGVEYLNYSQDEDRVTELAGDLSRERGLGAFTGGEPDAPESILIFVTPSGSYGFMNKIARSWGYDNARDVLGGLQSYFNFLAVDEASMMPLGQFLLSGAFTNEKSQILVGGDHRQMPPVQKHDWKEEDRRTVEEVAPHLSTLDFFRFLKGELNVEYTSPPGAEELPVERLKRTYRCHKRVAGVLRRWVYERYDDIEYRSEEEETISEPDTGVSGIQQVLDPEHPLILVLHDEERSQQANPTEVEIAGAIVDAVPEEEDWGIVTPHNAQRGLLKNEIGDDADIDTVERYQGGERDVIIVSGTASDRESIRKKHDFILNPNRLNVAMSRMKKKLIIIASRSMFEVIPTDAEDYEDALLWRGLYHEVEADRSEPLWAGNLSDISQQELRGEVEDAYIEVYSGD